MFFYLFVHIQTDNGRFRSEFLVGHYNLPQLYMCTLINGALERVAQSSVAVDRLFPNLLVALKPPASNNSEYIHVLFSAGGLE